MLGLILLYLVPVVLGLDGIVTPADVVADQSFEITFEPGGSDPRDQYRVFLAAASVGQNGPMCYLQNLTSLTSPFTATIPACVGPDGDDYSIGIADITTGQGATFGNKFNFTGGAEQYTPYEKHLGGAPFWNAYDLPCSAMSCARQCAQAEYPADLSDDTSYATMSACIETCPGVAASQNNSVPITHGQADDVPVAVITLASDVVVTAWQTVVSTGSSSTTEAILGTQTIALGASIQTISSATLSLASAGVIVGASSTVPFTTSPHQFPTTVASSTVTGNSQGSTSQQGEFNVLLLGLAALPFLVFQRLQ